MAKLIKFYLKIIKILNVYLVDLFTLRNDEGNISTGNSV